MLAEYFQRDMVIDDDSISGTVFGTEDVNDSYVWLLNIAVDTDKPYKFVEKWIGTYNGRNSENYECFDIGDSRHYHGNGLFSIPFAPDEVTNMHLAANAHFAVGAANITNDGTAIEDVETHEFDLSNLQFELNMEG